MKKKYWIILAQTFCLYLFLTVSGCDDIQFGDWMQAKYDRTVQRQVPLAAGSTVVAETSFGSVTITGAEVTDCNVVATICSKAPTEQEAQELAEQVKIELETVGDTLTVKAEKPPKKGNRSISISYNITVPKQTNVNCASKYGKIKLTDINGNVAGKSSSGSITAENIQGTADLDTSYGPVDCRNITGDYVKIKSSSGSITADSIKGSAELNTSYGSITCKDMSDGDFQLKTSSGTIKLSNTSFGNCDAHTSYGSVTADKLEGDSIKLHSDSGSIKVTEASADTTNISTSYGRISCQQITTNHITARSGSGNIDIACSDSTPDEIVTDLVTSYGNIDFTAPRNFTGQVDMSTSYGSIRTERPITISGEVSKKKLKGTIGQGKGKLHLQTSSGSINVK